MNNDDDDETEDPLDLMWYMATTAAVVIGWLAFGGLWLFAEYSEVSPPIKWFFCVPSVCGTFAVLFTTGVTFIPPPKRSSLSYSDAYDTQHRILLVLCTTGLVVFGCGEWGSAFILAFKFWFKPGEWRAILGLLLIQFPFFVALVMRYRQLMSQYNIWRRTKTEEEGY